MKTYHSIYIAACAALLSSCGIYTTYHPATEVPEQLYGEEVVVSDSSSIASLHWRELFTDPYLVTLIEQGLANNTDYLAAGVVGAGGGSNPALRKVGLPAQSCACSTRHVEPPRRA